MHYKENYSSFYVSYAEYPGHFKDDIHGVSKIKSQSLEPQLLKCHRHQFSITILDEESQPDGNIKLRRRLGPV